MAAWEVLKTLEEFKRRIDSVDRSIAEAEANPLDLEASKRADTLKSERVALVKAHEALQVRLRIFQNRQPRVIDIQREMGKISEDANKRYRNIERLREAVRAECRALRELHEAAYALVYELQNISLDPKDRNRCAPTFDIDEGTKAFIEGSVQH